MEQVQLLQQQIQPVRQQLVDHPLYHNLQQLTHLQTFAQYHVYAVWDFMSLLKSLQRQLTCTQAPWLPVGDANTRYLINEIVLGEESDVDAAGNRISHFELYLQAMQQMQADTTAIEQLITYLKAGKPVRDAIALLQLPQAVQQFLQFTFEVIEQHPVHVQAAVFTFGREDLIPDMFMGIVKDMNRNHPGHLSTFTYYLERHIEVDGDHHSHLALEMVTRLCGDDTIKWQQATEACIAALQKRKALWDAILENVASSITA